jgi:putative peptidoglycan lipid II flippase
LVIQILIASRFGASANVDAYLIAISAPELIVNIYAIGGTIILVPLLTKLHDHPSYEAKNVVDSTISFISIAIFVIAVSGFIIAPFFIKLVAPGFNSSTAHLSIIIFRLLMVFLVFASLNNILSGIFHAYSHFNLPALFRLVQLLIVIAVFLLFTDKLGIIALAVGLTLASFLSFLWQAILINKYDYSFKLHLSYHEIKEIASPLLIFVFVFSAPQLNTIIDRIFATTLTRGSVAILDFATKFEPVLVGIIAFAIVTPVYTKLSESVSRKNLDEFKINLHFGMRALLVSIAPVVVLIVVLRQPIISVFLQRGQFSATDTIMVADILLYLSPTYIIGAFAILFLYAFFALKETHWLLAFIGIGVINNIILNTIFIKPWGIIGIALSTSISAVPMTVILWFYLKKKFVQLNFLSYQLILKIITSSVLSGLVIWPVYKSLTSPVFFHKILAIVVSFILTLIIYFCFCYLLGVKDIQKLFKRNHETNS